MTVGLSHDSADCSALTIRHVQLLSFAYLYALGKAKRLRSTSTMKRSFSTFPDWKNGKKKLERLLPR